MFFVAAIPAIILVNINVEFFEEHHPKRADFRPYEYMRKRQKVIRNDLSYKIKLIVNYNYFYLIQIEIPMG
jgi:hypothetical protein